MEPAELRATLAANIRRRAAEKGWSVAELADFAGLARGALYRVVNEEASATIDTLAKLAAAIECAPADLLAP